MRPTTHTAYVVPHDLIHSNAPRKDIAHAVYNHARRSGTGAPVAWSAARMAVDMAPGYDRKVSDRDFKRWMWDVSMNRPSTK